MLKHRAFSLVEVLVATILVAVGVSALIGALTAFTRTEFQLKDRDLQSRITHEKLDELIATGDYESQTSGGFDQPELQDFTWRIEELPTDIAGATDVRITVSSAKLGDTTAETIVFRTQDVVNTNGTDQ